MIHTGPSGAGPSTARDPTHDDGVGKWKEADKGQAGPVKAACLSCRQKKAKCDGAKPACGQCSRKQVECIYIKSKRGGARKKRDPNPPLPLVEYLKKLDQLLGVPQFGLRHAEPQEGDDPTNIVRTFGSREETLRCYYNEVHPYLPVLPPRHYLVDVLPTLLEDSPFLLAVQTIMTLIPHPLDPNAESPQSKRLRSAASGQLGKQTLACIESTLASGIKSLEIIQALTILAVWEWGSTNDAETAIARCSSAIQVAMDLGIHDMDRNGTGFALEGIDWRTDTKRRTWWILYVYQLTASLVSGASAPIGPDDDRIHVDFPICSDKDRTWSTWANCIRQCYRVVNIVNQLVFATGGPENTGTGWGTAPAQQLTPQQTEQRRVQMLEVDKEIMQLMKDAERMSVIEHVPGGEEGVATNQQIATRFSLAVAHIHIHRWTAFPEVSLFSKRICGLSKANANSDDESYDGSASALLESEMSVSPNVDGTRGSLPSQSLSPPNQRPSPQAEMLTPLPSAPAQFSHPLEQPPTQPSGSNGMSPYNPNAAAMFKPPTQGSPQSQPPTLSYAMTTGGSGSVFRDNEIMRVGEMMNNLASSRPYLPGRPDQQYNTNPGGTFPNMAFQPPGAYPTNPAPPLTVLPQRSSSLRGVSSTASITPFDSLSNTFNPALNAVMAPNDMGPGPAFKPMHQQQWHYDLQQSQAAFPELIDDMWRPETYPSNLPTPWFAQAGGAGQLFPASADTADIVHYPAIERPLPAATTSSPAGPTSSLTSTAVGKKHKAWGVDANGRLEPNADVEAAQRAATFPPGISLARCATAAHTIVRLEVLHRSATLAMDGTPRWIPFCSCGLVSGAYAFLLLILAVQAENTFGEYSQERNDEIENLLTNIRVILAGLEAYGIMWEGIDMMAREVRAVVEAATRLPMDIRSQKSDSPQLEWQ